MIPEKQIEMSKFTTPCYVRIENAKRRKELTEWLESIGYIIIYYHGDIISTHFIRPDYGVEKWEFSGHDCGTNTELFLALAGMRSDTHKGQWHIAQANIMFKKLKGEVITASKKRYISIGEMFMPLNQNLRFTWFGGSAEQLFRKATAAEIIEHFEKGGK